MVLWIVLKSSGWFIKNANVFKLKMTRSAKPINHSDLDVKRTLARTLTLMLSPFICMSDTPIFAKNFQGNIHLLPLFALNFLFSITPLVFIPSFKNYSLHPIIPIVLRKKKVIPS